MLLGLYHGLFKYFEIHPKTVLTWKREGILIQEKKEVFEEIPPRNRGQYYPWFLEYQDLLDPSQEPSTKVTDDFLNRLESVARAWRYIGGVRPLLINTPLNVIDIEKATWPQRKQNCFDLCELMLSDLHPSPRLYIWLSFGSMTFAQPETRRNATRDCPPYAGHELNSSTSLMIPDLSSNSSVPRI